jgi:hypothetical protein
MPQTPKKSDDVDMDSTGDLYSEKLAPKKGLPPLLQKLEERSPERLHYLGVSFGLTTPLFEFWKKNEFLPIYIRLTAVCPLLEIIIFGEKVSEWGANFLGANFLNFQFSFYFFLFLNMVVGYHG